MKRLRQDAGLWTWLGLALALVLVQLSGLDLALTRLGFDPARGAFIGHDFGWAQALYRGVPPAGWLMLLAAAMVLLLPRGRRRPAWRRGALAVWLIALVANGLVIDLLLKDYWGRPRPRSVEAFGGPHLYYPVWQPAQVCTGNCSLPSGHAAAGFTLMGVGALAARRRWHRALAVGMVAGLGIGAARVLQGGHFPTDILASGLVVLGTCLLLRRGWVWARRLHWRRLAFAQGGEPDTVTGSGSSSANVSRSVGNACSAARRPAAMAGAAR